MPPHRWPPEDDFPVTGVRWYEAAAYAEFAGKNHDASGDTAE